MVDLCFFKNFVDFESILDLFRLTVDYWQMQLFCRGSKQEGHDDAPKEGIIVDRGVAQNKVADFAEGLGRNLMEELSKQTHLLLYQSNIRLITA